MTILQLTRSFSRGGRRNAILSLVDALLELGIACELACLDELGCEASELSPYSQSLHVTRRRSWRDWKAVAKLFRLCRDRDIDVVHAHDAASQWMGMLTRLRLPRIPLLMTFHRSVSIDSATYRDRIRNGMACAATSAVVTGSTERREHFLQNYAIPARKVVTIPFGVDTRQFVTDPAARQALRKEWNLPDEAVVVGIVGHFGPEKGVDVALRAFQAARQRSPLRPLALVVVGDGAAERAAELRALAALDPSASITFAGFRRDIVRCMQAFDILLHAPRQEAFGLVLIEAMAAGLPVIATRVGGIPDIVRHGLTGMLVPGEDVEAMSSCLAELADDPGLRSRLGGAGRQVAASEYDTSLYARRYARLYRALLDGHAPVGADEQSGLRIDPAVVLQAASHIGATEVLQLSRGRESICPNK